MRGLQGETMGAPEFVHVNPLAPGEVADISVVLQAPRGNVVWRVCITHACAVHSESPCTRTRPGRTVELGAAAGVVLAAAQATRASPH